MIVTIFSNINDTKKPHWRNIEFVLERIRTGKSKTLIDLIRVEPDKDKRNLIKKQLASVCFSGKFKERNNNSLLDHSGFICLDFDDCSLEKKEELKKDEFIFSAWVSPSGNGVKALIRIPVDNHLASFRAIQKRYPNIDNACKDVSRVCYESYDPDIFINPDAEVFKEQLIETVQIKEIKNPLQDSDKIYEYIKKWLDRKGEYFSEGNRNNFLCKILSACNRFGISQENATDYVLYDFVNGSTNFKLTELRAVANSVYGLYSHQANTAKFQDDDIVTKTTNKTISEEIIDFSLPAKDIIFLEDIKEDMLEQFDNGIEKGETTGYTKLDNHFRWLRGELTCMYGIGNHGKSSMLAQMMLIKSVMCGWRWAIFSPEQYPPTFFYDEFIQMYVGKSVMKDSKNKMQREDYLDAMNFVNEHFFYLFPEDNDPTPEYINERFREVIRKKKVDGVVVDPFNQMYHVQGNQRDDQYLSKILREFKNFATRENIHYLVVAHTNGKISKKDNGELETPYYTWHLAGGAMWGNKCDNILVYHRPHYKTDPDNNTCLLVSQKIKKQQINGRPGEVEFTYDRSTFKFSESDGIDDVIFDNVDMKDYRQKSLEDEIPF